MGKHWIAVASADHVRRGVDGGFMQVSHGKAAPLRRLAPGDRIAYYSPHATFGGRDALMAFTAYGIVADGPIVEADMGGGFHPCRRPVRFLSDRQTPIRPLLCTPGFALSGPGWGAKLRFGLLQIDPASMDRIAAAMGVEAD